MDIPMYYAKYLNAKFYIFKINNIYNKERKFTTRGHYCYEEDSHSTKEWGTNRSRSEDYRTVIAVICLHKSYASGQHILQPNKNKL